MKTSGNKVLITGGATGIGFALAEALSKSDNTVIICGRREDKLKEAKQRLPSICIKVCDVSKESERKSLYGWVESNFDDLNMLVNNAGIQRPIDLRKGIDEILKNDDDEIEINFRSQVYLSARFIPFLSKKKDLYCPAISSSRSFVVISNPLSQARA